MKIEWTETTDCTEARLTRGWWRWRRVATVERREQQTRADVWVYYPSGDEVEPDLQRRLNGARAAELDRKRHEEHWPRVPTRRSRPALRSVS